MQTILVIGAGKTSIYLIEYLLFHANRNKWKVIVADTNHGAIIDKTQNHPLSEAAVSDITLEKNRVELISRSDLVISLLPPSLHILVARDCLKLKKHLITSSYVSPEMQELDIKAKEEGLMFMCEMGLDPGIDHMTANKAIHSIQKVAGIITSFKSYTGGLIAPESDTNPWHYKFTWNPRNVVLAGNMGAKYLSNNKEANIPYEELFANPKRLSKTNNALPLEYYPNRDSISYLDKYDLPDIRTFMRATLRYSGFMEAWNILVQLGLTAPDDAVTANTLAEWIKNKNGFNSDTSLEKQIAGKLNINTNDKSLEKVKWLGILEDKPLPQTPNNSADILLSILLDKWTLNDDDKDMIIMRHDFDYTHRSGQKTSLSCTMTLIGEDDKYSAMAKTVGLPMAILAKLLLSNKVQAIPGVQIPNIAPIYKPVLAELESHGIVFEETVS